MFKTERFILRVMNQHFACADPESFVRGGPTLTSFFCFCYFFSLMRGEKGSIYHYQRASNGGPASETPFKWRFVGGPMMAQHRMLAGRLIGSFVIFQGIPTSIAKEPYIF